MNSRSIWLTGLIVAAVSWNAHGATKIAVIQPGTNRLISHAEVSLFTTGGEPKRVEKGRTGMTGQPCTIADPDPFYAVLLVVVKKGPLQGSAKIVYDVELREWKPAVSYDFFETGTDYDETLGTWKPRTEYQVDESSGQWQRQAAVDDLMPEPSVLRVLTQKPEVIPVRRYHIGTSGGSWSGAARVRTSGSSTCQCDQP